MGIDDAVPVLVDEADVSCLVCLTVAVQQTCLLSLSLGGVDSVCLQAVELIRMTAYPADHLRAVAKGGHHLLVVAQRLDLAVGEGDVSADNPLEVAQTDERCLHGEFHSLVVNPSAVGIVGRSAVNRRFGHRHDDVFGVADVVVHTQLDAVAQEGSVETQVHLACLLRTQMGIGNLVADDARHIHVGRAAVVGLAVIRREAAVSRQAVFSTQVQATEPVLVLQCRHVLHHPGDTSCRIDTEAVGVLAGSRRAIDRHAERTGQDVVPGVVGVGIEVHPVPLLEVTLDVASDAFGGVHHLIEVVRRVPTEAAIVLVLGEQCLESCHGIHGMASAEHLLVAGIQVVEVVRGLSHSVAHGVGLLSVDVGHGDDGLLVLAGDEHVLLVVVVIQAEDSVHRHFLYRAVVEAHLDVHVILTAVRIQRVDQRQRVAHGEVHVLADAVIVVGVDGRHATVVVLLIGREERRTGVCGKNRVRAVAHALLLVVAVQIGKTDGRIDFEVAAHRHVTVQLGVEAVLVRPLEDAFLHGVTQREVILGDSVASLHTEQVVGRESVLINLVLPVGIVVVQVAVFAVGILHEGEVREELIHRVIVTDTDVGQVGLVVDAIEQRHALVVPVHAELSVVTDLRVQVVRLRTVGLNQDDTVGTHRTVHGCLGTLQHRDVLDVVDVVCLEDVTAQSVDELRVVVVRDVRHPVDDHQRCIVADEGAHTTEVHVASLSRHAASGCHLQAGNLSRQGAVNLRTSQHEVLLGDVLSRRALHIVLDAERQHFGLVVLELARRNHHDAHLLTVVQLLVDSIVSRRPDGQCGLRRVLAFNLEVSVFIGRHIRPVGH